MDMRDNFRLNKYDWAKYILLNCSFKLTSKDKLIACYLIYSRQMEENVFYYDAFQISQRSGLALRTVQKSIGRLIGIGSISFLSKRMFKLEEINNE